MVARSALHPLASPRFDRLDRLRGLALLWMAAFHFCFDLANWRLIQAPPHIINYVTAHELAHLKEMNHSAKFWAVVESIFADYKKAEKELKNLSPLLHAID